MGAKLGITLPNQQNATFNRDSQGWNIRANFGFDLASNTAYGPLIGHMDFNSDLGSGLDSPRGSFTYVNTYAGLASAMVALVFLYWTASIFVYGGELNSAIFQPRTFDAQNRAPASCANTAPPA